MSKKIFFSLATIFLCLGIIMAQFLIKDEEKDILYINLDNKPTSLSPHYAKTAEEKKIISSLYEGLFRVNIDGQTIGAAAKNYTVSEDNLTYKINLRGGHWSDGSELTSYDFQASWLYALTNLDTQKEEFYIIKNAKEFSENLVNKEDVGILCPDSLTLIITLEEPYPSFIEKLSKCIFFPVKENLSNGPYYLKDINDEEIILEKNMHYWDKSSISIMNINYILTSNFDKFNSSFIFDGKLFKEDENIIKSSYPTGEVSYLMFNSNKLNKNKRLYLYSQVEKIKNAQNSENYIQYGFVNNIATGDKTFYRTEYEIDNNYFKNIKEEKFQTLDLIYEKDNTTPFLYQLKNDFEKIGIHLNLISLTQTEFSEKEYNGEYDIAYKLITFPISTPYEQLLIFKSDNLYNYKNKSFDLKMEKVKNTDREDLFKLLNEAEMELIKNPPAVPLMYTKKTYYVSKDLKNILRLGFDVQNLDLYWSKVSK